MDEKTVTANLQYVPNMWCKLCCGKLCTSSALSGIELAGEEGPGGGHYKLLNVLEHVV